MKTYMIIIVAVFMACIPEPRRPTDTPFCHQACEKLERLGCEEGQPLSDGTTCTAFCINTQNNGFPLRPSCIVEFVEKCEDMKKCQ